MITGICFDLRSWYLAHGFTWEETAEFDKEETIEGIEQALAGLGFQTERIGNIFDLVEALASGKKWNLVFNISEGLYGPSRESVVPALLDQYRIPYVFSNAEVLGIALNKQLAKQVVAAAGVSVAAGYVVTRPYETENITFGFPMFVKPLYEGTGKGINEKSLVANPADLKIAVDHILQNHHQPALVEEFLPGREFTVGVVGSGATAKVVGAMEIFSQGAVYSLEVKENYEKMAHYKPLDEKLMNLCSDVALKSWIALGAVDGGRIDLRFNKDNTLCFIEANPLAGLNPFHSDLPWLARMNNISYTQLIGMIMESALARLNLKP
jgi:D-alanine-D-alanine ligase